MKFPPLEHVDILQAAWERPPQHDLSASGFAAPPWRARGLPELEMADPADFGTALGQKLRDRLAQRAGVPVEHCLVTTGTTGANAAVLLALLAPGDEVVCERPYYAPLPNLAIGMGSLVLFVDRRPGSWDLAADDVVSAMNARTRLVILTSPNNPTGAAIADDALRRIAEAAESCGAYVLVDQVYRELTDQAVAATLHPRILTTAGFNKCWGAPGLRIGWLIAQPDVLGRVHEANRLLGLAPPRAGQVGALMMLEHEARCRKQLEERLAHNHATFRRWAEARGADAAARGLVRFVALGPDLEARAAQRGLLLLPGRVFGTPGPYRIGFGGEPARFAAALEALASLRGAPRV